MDIRATILDPLNTEQRKAVETLEGPVLILAGAGSGKTRALTHRIAYLIENGVPPWQILAVTFTNKAANEMKERIKNLLKLTDTTGRPVTEMPMLGTFHSVCVRMLRRDIEQIGRDRNFVIYDSDDQEKLMKEVLFSMHIAPEDMKPRAALSHIGRFKSEAITVNDAYSQSSTHYTERIAKIYEEYQKQLKACNALDFDDLILETVRLLHDVPAVRERYQNTWRFIHIDEYQDTNHAQYLLVSLLAKEHGNLCVIGDPDQSIYAFRGADIRNILEFKNEYPGAAVIKLEQNYRSTQKVLDSADSVISVNPNRPEKKMWTEKSGGENIILEEVGTETLEAEHAIMKVIAHQKNGVGLNDQVILYRTNSQSRLLEEACLRHAVPYRILGSVKFYARREIKDVLGYLYAILNPADTVSLLRIINVPARKIGKTTITRLQAYANDHQMNLWQTLRHIPMVDGINDPTKERLAQFVLLIEDLQKISHEKTVAELIVDVLDTVQMEKWVKDDTAEGEARWENILELINVAKKYDNLEPHVSLTSFLEEVALVSEVDKLDQVQDDALTLMTVHLCKGLEFTSVMIVGCEEGLFPHAAANVDKDQLEEERRLMYVAMTRAKDYLHLFHARTRMTFGESRNNPRSRFLDDIPHTLLDMKSDDFVSPFNWNTGMTKPRKKLEPYRQHDDMDQTPDYDMNQDYENLMEGARVSHPHFGPGTVIDRKGDIAEIQFDSGATKKLALNIAPLSVI